MNEIEQTKRENEMSNQQAVYEMLKAAADQIEKLDSEMGFYAQRKVNSVSATSKMSALYRVANDLGLMAEKLETLNS